LRCESVLDLEWHTLRYLKLASERGLGTLDFDHLKTSVAQLG